MKQDLNLLPRKEKQPAYSLILPVLLIALLLAAALYAGIAIPNSHLADLRQQQSQILNDRSLYANVSAEFQQQNAELQDLLNKKAAIDQTFDTSHAPTKLLAVIERSCPATIQLTNLSVNESGIVLQGVSPYDNDVAQFMVNLRESGLFDQAHISYVSPVNFTEVPLLEGEVQQRSFSLILNYPVVDTDTTEGGTEQ